jgi:hypothetical protein
MTRGYNLHAYWYWNKIINFLSVFICVLSLKNWPYNQHCFAYNVQVGNFREYKLHGKRTSTHAALDAVGTVGKSRVRHWRFGSRRLNRPIGETKQFYHHTFYFNYIKDINFHNFSIAKVTKPDFPRHLKPHWHCIQSSRVLCPPALANLRHIVTAFRL